MNTPTNLPSTQQQGMSELESIANRLERGELTEDQAKSEGDALMSQLQWQKIMEIQAREHSADLRRQLIGVIVLAAVLVGAVIFLARR